MEELKSGSLVLRREAASRLKRKRTDRCQWWKQLQLLAQVHSQDKMADAVSAQLGRDLKSAVGRTVSRSRSRSRML